VRDANLTLFDESDRPEPDSAARRPVHRRPGPEHRRQLQCRCQRFGQAGACGRPTMLLPADTGPNQRQRPRSSHLDLAALGANAPCSSRLRSFRFPPTCPVKFNIVQGGHVSQTDFDLSAAATFPGLPSRATRCMCASCASAAIMTGSKITWRWATPPLDAPEAQVKLKGGADFVYDAKGALDSIAADLFHHPRRPRPGGRAGGAGQFADGAVSRRVACRPAQFRCHPPQCHRPGLRPGC